MSEETLTLGDLEPGDKFRFLCDKKTEQVCQVTDVDSEVVAFVKESFPDLSHTPVFYYEHGSLRFILSELEVELLDD